MTTAQATLAGHACTRVRAQVPAWGLWWADVEISEPETLTGRATLQLADLAMQCAIVSGGPVHGRAAYRVVAGAGGWGKRLAAKSYRDDAGVRASVVLGDAVREMGETIALGALEQARLGPHFARADALASMLLHQLSPQAWYVDYAGVTRIGTRAAITYGGDGARVRVDPLVGVIDLATDEIAALAPGAIVDGSAPATDVEFSLDTKRLTARVYAGRRSSRRLSALARAVEALDPLRRYRGTYEFRVVTQEGERLNLQPVRAATGLPDLPGVPVRPGMAGLRSNVQLGELVLVTFVDADPSRPVVIAHDAPDAPGWMPLTIELGGPGALGVARLTDAVVAGPFAGAITFASARVKASV